LGTSHRSRLGSVPRGRSGFTLIEVLVAGSLALLVMGLAYAMFMLSDRYFRITDVKTEVQLNALLASQRLQNELRGTIISSVTNATGSAPPALCFQTAYDGNGVFQTDDYANPVWQSYVIYYLPVGSTTMRRFSFASPATVSPLGIAEVQSYCTGSGRIVGYDVIEFSAQVNAAESLVTVNIGTRADSMDRRNQTAIAFTALALNRPPSWIQP